MPITKDAKLEALRVGMRGEFKRVLDGSENEWKDIATVIPSTTGVNAYGWMGDFPHLQEWTGDRAIKNIKEYGFTVENKKYEATLGIKRTDLEDDNLGMYDMMAGVLWGYILLHWWCLHHYEMKHLMWIKSERLYSEETNTNYNMVNVIVSAYL